MDTDEQDGNDTHAFKKKKSGFEIDTVDPIQDIMSDTELDNAHERILSLIEDKNEDNGGTNE
jgi:hypothetical protein